MIDDVLTDDDNELAGLNEKALLAGKPLDARRRIEQMQEEKRLREIIAEDWSEKDA